MLSAEGRDMIVELLHDRASKVEASSSMHALGVRHGYSFAAEFVASLKANDGWRPVEEPPEHGMKCLIQYENGWIGVSMCIRDDEGISWRDSFGKAKFWRPLPKPRTTT